jgi:hypothetical protein
MQLRESGNSLKVQLRNRSWIEDNNTNLSGYQFKNNNETEDVKPAKNVLKSRNLC